MSARAARAIYLVIIFATLLLTALTSEAAETTEALVKRTAVKYNIDPDLALAIMEVESGGNPHAIGTKGELGLYQLHPRYHTGATFDVDRNIYLGIRYLARCRATCGKRFGSAFFVCFNRGPSTKIREPKKTEYYRRVTAAYYAIKSDKRLSRALAAAP